MLLMLPVPPVLTSVLQFERVLEDMTEVALRLVARGQMVTIVANVACAPSAVEEILGQQHSTRSLLNPS